MEFAVIEGIKHSMPPAPEGEVWIGDDAAVIQGSVGMELFAADLVVAGVHADLSIVTLEDFGWKAIAVNVSDIAAMGGVPRYAVVSIAGASGGEVEKIYRGIKEASDEYGVRVVGGDLSSGKELVVSVAVIGTTEGRPPLLRSGARPGDFIFVTGPLGSSAAGLALLRDQRREARDGEARDGEVRDGEARDGEGVKEADSLSPEAISKLAHAYSRPRARLAEGVTASIAGASAMIDISDGFSADLNHLASDSRVGVELFTVPVAVGATLVDALGGGEDYELIFTAARPEDVFAEFERAGLTAPLIVGRCAEEPSLRSLDGGVLPVVGWEHNL